MLSRNGKQETETHATIKQLQPCLISLLNEGVYPRRGVIQKIVGEGVRMAKLHSPSEVHAYSHILNELVGKKDWGKEQVYAQQECLTIKAIAEPLGQTHPENIIEVSETVYYVIESKNERQRIDIALKEAKEDYADLINQSSQVKAPFITGIAGNNEEGFIATSQFFKDGKWETITENGVEVTGLLSRGQVGRILSENTPHLEDIEINESEFLKTAEEINGILHEGGCIRIYGQGLFLPYC